MPFGTSPSRSRTACLSSTSSRRDSTSFALSPIRRPTSPTPDRDLAGPLPSSTTAQPSSRSVAEPLAQNPPLCIQTSLRPLKQRSTPSDPAASSSARSSPCARRLCSTRAPAPALPRTHSRSTFRSRISSLHLPKVPSRATVSRALVVPLLLPCRRPRFRSSRLPNRLSMAFNHFHPSRHQLQPT